MICAHAFEFAGRWMEHPIPTCEHPNVVECQRCGARRVVRCQGTREDRCSPCGKRHNLRLRRLFRSGFTGRPTGFYFVTATGPGQFVKAGGADGIPWDLAVCGHTDPRRCSGPRGCRSDRGVAGWWNTFAPQAWSWLVEEVRRALPGVDVQFAKCWETHERGVLHLHAIIWALGVSEARMCRVWSEALAHVYDVEGGRWGWGVEQTCERIGSKLVVDQLVTEMQMTVEDAELAIANDEQHHVNRAAWYAAKYCTKGGKRACTFNRQTGELRHDGRGYRTWSASSRWGERMKAIRAEQRSWAEANGQPGASRAAVATVGSLDPDGDIYATHEGLSGLVVPAVELSVIAG